MGMRITQLQPSVAFCAETAGRCTLLGTAYAGNPVSTTHTITGAIVGCRCRSVRLSAVRGGLAADGLCGRGC
jgi:phosphate/sulfate permease